MANEQQQIKNSFIYIAQVFVSSLIPLIALTIFTRILTKEDYGVLALAQVYAIFFSGMANFGMTSAYDRNYFQYRDDRVKMAQLLYSVLLFVIVNCVLIASLTNLFRDPLAKLILGSNEYGNILFWAFCAQSISSMNYYYMTYFKNSETAKDFAVYTIATGALNFIVSLIFVAYLKTGVIGLLYAQFFSGAAIFTILSYKFASTLSPSISKSVFYGSLKISYPLTPRIFLGIISTQFDKYMIGLLNTVGGVGIYSIGQKVSYLIFTCMTAIQNVFSPQVYKRMFDLGEEGGRSIGRYITPFVYLCVAFALIISLFSEEVIHILTPVSYHGAINIVIILSMFYGFMFFGKINGSQLIFMKKTHITSILTLVTIVLNIGLNIPFIIKWGVVGAAWATLLAGITSGLISFAVSQHYYEIKWEYKKVVSIYCIFFISSILIVLLRNYNIDYSMRLVFKAASVSLFTYLGMKYNIITRDNFLMVKDIIVKTKSKEAVA
jgi:O-antigen/teichoic acid export membrane protein